MLDSYVGIRTVINGVKELYPRIVNIKTVKVDKLWREVNFKEDTHKAIYIETMEGGKIQAIIHKSIADSIMSGYVYQLWWDRTDKHHDRWLEIIDFELMEKTLIKEVE